MNDQTSRPGDAPSGGPTAEAVPQPGLQPFAQPASQPFDPASYGPPQPQPPQPQPLLAEQPAKRKKKARIPVEAGLVAGAQIGVLQVDPAHTGQAQYTQLPAKSSAAQYSGAGPITSASAKPGLFASTTAKVIAGCVAVVIVGAGAVAWTAVSQVGGAGNQAASAGATSSGTVSGEAVEPAKPSAGERTTELPQETADKPAEVQAEVPAQETQPEPEPIITEPVVEDVNGRWCTTPETTYEQGCYGIELPMVTYPSGDTYEFMNMGYRDDLGGFGFSVPGAPFGFYYPAGIALELPDYYPGADVPDQDRIWNSQTGTMLVRE